jgi:hypothetical protein
MFSFRIFTVDSVHFNKSDIERLIEQNDTSISYEKSKEITQISQY